MLVKYNVGFGGQVSLGVAVTRTAGISFSGVRDLVNQSFARSRVRAQLKFNSTPSERRESKMAANSQSKKVVHEAVIWGAVAIAFIFAHTYVLPFDTLYRLLLPIFLTISILTKRDVPFNEKMESHAMWATALSLILFIFLVVAWRAPVVRSLILAVTMVGFFAPATYVLSLIMGPAVGMMK